ncbi:MAG: integration host factor subunit beta [Phycisphaerales bacterium]|nr:MAG: integration host factor subunit beta [Phycisphaerales bacterium]
MATAGTANSARTNRAPRTQQADTRTVTKKDLVDRIASESGLKRADVKLIVQAFLDAIVDDLGQGNRIEFRDFGVFETKLRAPRVAQNPKTLERVEVPAKRTVKFKVGRLMRERMEPPAETGARPKASVQAELKPELKPERETTPERLPSRTPQNV